MIRLAERSAHTNDGARPRPVIYVVDDKVSVAEYVATECQRLGCSTQVFQRPLAALSAFASAASKPALLVADFSMPEMDGLELMRRCRHICPSLKVIIISGTVSAKVLGGSGLGVDQVLDKPLALGSLKAAVESLLGRNPADEYAHGECRLDTPPSTAAGSSLIYVVDDEYVIAEMVAMHLLRGGYRARVFESSIAALAAFASEVPKPSLLITDFGMPQMSGSELMRKCRQQSAGVKVILMTGSLSADALELREPKPDAVLDKPFTPGQLLGEVGTMVA
jgi:CheY-like chemotaxis protein